MPSENEILRKKIDDVSHTTGIGSLSDAYTNALRGINHRGLGNPINTNHDNSGIVFFTRPNLNLTYDNIAVHRTLMPLATQNADTTIQRYIRTMLDPKGAFFRDVTSPLVNHRSPFIPVLTNNTISISGWPDIAPDTYRSKDGVRKESWAMIDGVYRIMNGFSLTANFRNIAGDPITTLLNTWIQYATSVKLGEMVPYPECIVENEIDYQCRIYRFVLDPSRRFIQKCAATGVSFPSTTPMGAAFNYSGDQTFTQETGQINVQFECTGADYNDPITFEEFNELVGIFNSGLKIKSLSTSGDLIVEGNYYQLKGSQLKKASYNGTPLIHPYTHELTWWVDEAEYNEIALR